MAILRTSFVRYCPNVKVRIPMNPIVIDVLKLLVVFAVIIGVIWLKRPMWMAVLLASIVTVLIYRLQPGAAWQAFLSGAKGPTTLQALLVFYTITFLQRMMEKRKNLSNSQVALNGLFNNRRINASIVPFLLGCLPAASTVLICGPIVRESVGDYLTSEEKAAVTSYYRHISESFLPTYTTIFIAIGLTNGAVTATSFLLAMIPMVIALFAIGHFVYLRRVPKDTGMIPDRTKGYYWKLLGKSIWQFVLAITLILAFQLPVWLAVIICIALNIFVNRFSFKELRPFFRSAFEKRLMLSTWLVMIFKELLSATGVITILPEFFSTLSIPTFLVFAIIFFFGAIVAGTQAIVVLCMPMAMASLSGGPALALFVLLMCMSYLAAQLSPVHICLTMCAEDYKVTLGGMCMKTLPMVLAFSVICFGYYFLLAAVGF